MMKTIQRETIEELAGLYREFVRTGDADAKDKVVARCCEVSNQLYGSAFYTFALCDTLGACCGPFRLAELNDDEICEVFKAFKIEVKE